MNFIDITTLAISTELDVLKRDTQRNSLLLYQHKGDFFADVIGSEMLIKILHRQSF